VTNYILQESLGASTIRKEDDTKTDVY